MGETSKATLEIEFTDGTTVTWTFGSDNDADFAAGLLVAELGEPDSIRC